MKPVVGKLGVIGTERASGNDVVVRSRIPAMRGVGMRQRAKCLRRRIQHLSSQLVARELIQHRQHGKGAGDAE